MITGYAEYPKRDLVIPDEVDGIPVIGVGDKAFSGCETLTGITIPDSVTSIGEKAFSGCSQVTLNVTPGSCAEQYAKESGIAYTIAE